MSHPRTTSASRSSKSLIEPNDLLAGFDLDKDIDDLGSDELRERAAVTFQCIEVIKKLWPKLIRLPEGDRRLSAGRNVGRLGAPLRLLFTTLTTKPGEKETALAKAFHLLGAQDHGDDPEHFEPELLTRRLDRVETEQKILDGLEDLARHFGDDVLNTGELVLGPGMLALELARTLAKTHTDFRTQLAPVFDALGEMTKHARRRLAAKRAEDEAREKAKKTNGKAEAGKGDTGRSDNSG